MNLKKVRHTKKLLKSVLSATGNSDRCLNRYSYISRKIKRLNDYISSIRFEFNKAVNSIK
jgi:hypothetical protein